MFFFADCKGSFCGAGYHFVYIRNQDVVIFIIIINIIIVVVVVVIIIITINLHICWHIGVNLIAGRVTMRVVVLILLLAVTSVQSQIVFTGIFFHMCFFF